MSHYVIGDVQGCNNELQLLLNKIKFNPSKDTIVLAGDLVNRGEDSLGVMEFCISNPESVQAVLGNHDFYLMYLISKGGKDESLQSILDSSIAFEIYDWMRSTPLLRKITINKSNEKFYISHAGIPFLWSLDDAESFSDEISKALRDEPSSLLDNIWGDVPKRWSNDLSGHERQRVIINYFTRMRFVEKNGSLNLSIKDAEPRKGLYKWFNQTKTILSKDEFIVFGHWASIEGNTNLSNIIGLDTGCVWGKKLTAIRLEDKKMYSVNRNGNL